MTVVKKKHKIFNTLVALIIGVAVMLPCFCKLTIVSASKKVTVNPIAELPSNGLMISVVKQVNNYSSSEYGFDLLAHNGTFAVKTEDVNGITVTIQCTEALNPPSNETCYVCFNNEKYSELTTGERQDLMTYALGVVTDASQNEVIRVKLYNFIASQDQSVSAFARNMSNDVHTDFATAWGYVKPFTGVLGTFLGVGSLVIMITLALSVISDLAYIALPYFRNLLDTRQSSNKDRPPFVSREAIRSIKEAEGEGTKAKTTVVLYFKYKTLQLAMVSLCLLYLASGQIFSFVGWLINLFEGAI